MLHNTNKQIKKQSRHDMIMAEKYERQRESDERDMHTLFLYDDA